MARALSSPKNNRQKLVVYLIDGKLSTELYCTCIPTP